MRTSLHSDRPENCQQSPGSGTGPDPAPNAGGGFLALWVTPQVRGGAVDGSLDASSYSPMAAAVAAFSDAIASSNRDGDHEVTTIV